MRTGILFVAAILVTGCASTYIQDGVSSEETSKVAVVEIELGVLSVGIQEVDDKWRGMGLFSRYKLKPGLRKLKLVLMDPALWSTRAILVEFNAEAGHTYRTRSNANRETKVWNPEIIDASTNNVVSKQIGTAFAY